mmetsp:Transcript_35734/g.47151  ORF Transcript_35734/g.47151 Transcript_35734/m.47151 type:complete len:137 (+) Transcript_35734:1314-1724(+)
MGGQAQKKLSAFLIRTVQGSLCNEEDNVDYRQKTSHAGVLERAQVLHQAQREEGGSDQRHHHLMLTSPQPRYQGRKAGKKIAKEAQEQDEQARDHGEDERIDHPCRLGTQGLGPQRLEGDCVGAVAALANVEKSVS